MICAQEPASPPSRLPLWVLLGGIVAAAALLLAHQEPVIDWKALSLPASDLIWRIAASLGVLVPALLLALSLALGVAMLARRLGARARSWAALLGRVMACVPVVVLAWGFVAIWTGRHGGPVETLMPSELPSAQIVWQTQLARTLWTYLVPALLLAVPLTGELMHAVNSDAATTVDLDFALRARGVPRGRWYWRHHLSQLLPLVHARAHSLCLLVPVHLIVIEDVVRFMGWGGWMAQSIRAGDENGIALGFASGGVLLALLCAGMNLQRARLRPSRGWFVTIVWQPWPLWALGLTGVTRLTVSPWVLLWAAVLMFGSASWFLAWNALARQLPLEPARSLGSTAVGAWRRHVAGVQFRMLLAWICSALAQTLLWMCAACVLQPRLMEAAGRPAALLFGSLVVASPQDVARLFSDPTALMQAGGVIALAVLCLVQASRIIQPRSLRAS